MNIKDLKRLLPYLAKANVSAFVFGHHGIGKSQAVKQLASELFYDHPRRGRVPYSFYDLRVGTMDVGDLVGLADFVYDSEGKKIGSEFFPPMSLPRDPDEKGFLFLDEFNLAKKEMHNSMFSLVLDGFMASYVKPKGIYVIAAGNPDTDDYDVTRIFSKALLARFCQLKLENDVDCWVEHAENNNVDVDVINLMQGHRSSFMGPEFKLEIQGDNRSLFAIDRIIKTGIPDDLFIYACSGLIGPTLTAAFLETKHNKGKPVAAEDILNNYPKFRTRVKALSSSAELVRMDALSISCDNITRHTDKLYAEAYEKTTGQIDYNKGLDQEQANNLITFLLDIPRELMFTTVKKLSANQLTYKIVNNNNDIKTSLEIARGLSVESLNKKPTKKRAKKVTDLGNGVKITDNNGKLTASQE